MVLAVHAERRQGNPLALLILVSLAKKKKKKNPNKKSCSGRRETKRRDSQDLARGAAFHSDNEAWRQLKTAHTHTHTQLSREGHLVARCI